MIWKRSTRDWRLPAEDDTSPRADLLRAIRMVEKEQTGVTWSGLGCAGLAIWRYEESLGTTGALLVMMGVIALISIHNQVSALRIDGFKRELRSLPPKWPS
ncbi:hypothetical protein [Rubellimicrobium roseum]|uniref:Uncharacterized protein n=1 Tax=Rubellimicrobium roseum TaxID=687525 RepID=A0A5C4NHR6_9RHOB|nr:hypothetical protein [Rubellimicrobium roseum]TNC74153.1 hypothetical protein FHG71_02875 [Rubellimicrobium roseum]